MSLAGTNLVGFGGARSSGGGGGLTLSYVSSSGMASSGMPNYPSSIASGDIVLCVSSIASGYDPAALTASPWTHIANQTAGSIKAAWHYRIAASALSGAAPSVYGTIDPSYCGMFCIRPSASVTTITPKNIAGTGASLPLSVSNSTVGAPSIFTGYVYYAGEIVLDGGLEDALVNYTSGSVYASCAVRVLNTAPGGNGSVDSDGGLSYDIGAGVFLEVS